MAMFSRKAEPKQKSAEAPTLDEPKVGIWSELVDGAARAFGFPRRQDFAAQREGAASAPAAKPKKQSRKASRKEQGPRRVDAGRVTAEAARLAADGVDRVEIARRTGLSQDTIGLLIHLAPTEAAETAAGGTFFRILQARMSLSA